MIFQILDQMSFPISGVTRIHTPIQCTRKILFMIIIIQYSDSFTRGAKISLIFLTCQRRFHSEKILFVYSPWLQELILIKIYRQLTLVCQNLDGIDIYKYIEKALYNYGNQVEIFGLVLVPSQEWRLLQPYFLTTLNFLSFLKRKTSVK